MTFKEERNVVEETSNVTSDTCVPSGLAVLRAWAPALKRQGSPFVDSLSDLGGGGYYPMRDAQTDQQLLRDYAGSHSDPAFTELVRRHIDL